MQAQGLNMQDVSLEWKDAHKFSPAPRHRRRIIYSIIRRLEFVSCLDAGCAQPYLLDNLRRQGKRVYGCDISRKVIEANRRDFPNVEFEVVDISRETYPLDKKFDLVISSEVLEHIADWRQALANLALMSKRYLLITAPSGKVHKIDRLVGHLRHYGFQELRQELERNNFKVVFHKNWGEPFHSLYKHLINALGYKGTYAHFACRSYGFFEKLFSHFLYFLFYFNDIFPCGAQLFILAQRDNQKD
jgi:hypothetical protein